MTLAHRLALAALGIALSAPTVAAQDLSAYRSVRLGTSIATVSAQGGAGSSAPSLVQQRPALIKELVWMPSAAGAGGALEGAPVQDIVFTFYDDKLFRIVATYDRAKIAGLTDDDLINSMTAQYGTATVPLPAVTSARLSQAFRDTTDRVLARWEDAQYSVNLVRSTYGAAVSLVMFSKPLDQLARAALIEAARLDTLEAPAREAARQQQQNSDVRAEQDKARLVNQPTFRP